MAVSRISKFNWDGILNKVDSSDVKRSLNLLRGKANEITANNAKYAKAPAPIDFAAYKNKLKFTSAAVSTLENLHKSKTLPTYTASLPAFESKKRALMLSVAQSTVEAAKADLESLQSQLNSYQPISDDTSVGDLQNKFPNIAKTIENEIATHQWLKDSNN